MFQYALAMLAQAAAPTPAEDCAANAKQDGYHLVDVCSDWIEGRPAYAATYRASLIPRPASQQVLVYKSEDGWRMRVAGYVWDRDKQSIQTKRSEFDISAETVRIVTEAVNVQTIQSLKKLHYYGSPDVICTDGAKYSVAMAQGNMRYSASQHSCADPSQLHQTMALFRDIAIKHDPSFDGMLYGLKSRK